MASVRIADDTPRMKVMHVSIDGKPSYRDLVASRIGPELQPSRCKRELLCGNGPCEADVVAAGIGETN